MRIEGDLLKCRVGEVEVARGFAATTTNNNNNNKLVNPSLQLAPVFLPMLLATRPSALGMSDPVMEFLEFHEKGKIFWVRGGRF